MRLASFALTSGLFLIGCRSDGTSTTDGPAGGDAAGSVKIQQVQNDAMAPGTAVSLSGVVVTAIDNYGVKTGDIWVEEPEGGPFSGVHVYKADTGQVAALQLGDIVDVTGAVKSEFALTSDTTGRTVTELEPAMSGQFIQVTKTGSGTVPMPAVVNALDIGMMSDVGNNGDRTMAWEQWEGVLITLSNVSAVNAPKCVGSACSDPLLQNFGITGVAQVESSMAAFPDGIVRTTCLANVTGVVDYFFDYLVLPRTTSEVSTGGTSCPPPEATPQLCENTTDDDGNGFADCNDDGCVVGDTTCRAQTTVSSLDTMASGSLPTGGLEIGSSENLYVTAIATNGRDFWVSKFSGTTPTAAQNEGMYVFGGSTLPSTITVGKQVSLIGKIKDYNNDTMGNSLREFSPLQVTAGAGSVNPTTIVPIAMQASALADAKFVGSMVVLTNVKITTAQTAANHTTGVAQQGTTTFHYGGSIFQDASAANTCYASIKGIWTYDVFDNDYELMPIAAGTAGTGC